MASGAMDKSPDAFRTISEVAEDLDVPQHVLRFWETRFSHIKPLKRGGGRRYYRPDDVDLLKGIRHLLYGEGYTIKGVQRILKEEGVRFVHAVGRGEQSVSAPHPEASVEPCRRDLPEEALRCLQTALDELFECDRVLTSLKGGEASLGE
jgi:DNA-binding transcriptional MerR regulator